jgi:6-phosphofructokinase
LCLPAEAQEFKKGFEAAAESNAALVSSTATVGGDGTAEAADALADELGKAKVAGEEGEGPAAAAAEPAAKEEAQAEA